MEEQVEQSQQREPQAARNDGNEAGHSERLRQRMELELQRERILDERTSNPIRRRALEAALADIEARLARL